VVTTLDYVDSQVQLMHRGVDLTHGNMYRKEHIPAVA
jgi:hypothetical protein